MSQAIPLPPLPDYTSLENGWERFDVEKMAQYARAHEANVRAALQGALDAQLAGLQAMKERADKAERERDEALKECKLLEHKVITCGVAAAHPNAALTETGAYKEKWNSPQAESVRQLRRELAAARQEIEALMKERDKLRKAIEASIFSLSGYAPPAFNSASAILQNAIGEIDAARAK